jgi:hypothetical protein
LEVECLPNDKEFAEDCELEWEANLDETETELIIGIKFKSPPKVSQGERADHALVKFWGAPTLYNKEGIQLFEYPQMKIVPIPP